MSLLHRNHNEVETASARSWLADLPNLWSSWLDERGPRIEERREDGNIVVRFEMPGIDPDKDVDVTVSDGMLRIRAERREETTGDDKDGYRSEFRYGSYARTVALPAGSTEDDVKATYRDGILEVRVPVNEAAADSKRVPITRI